MNCRYCGSYNPENAKFCEKCGMKIEVNMQEADFSDEQAKEPAKTPRRFSFVKKETGNGGTSETGASDTDGVKNDGCESSSFSYSAKEDAGAQASGDGHGKESFADMTGAKQDSAEDEDIPVYEEPAQESPVYEKGPDVIEGEAAFVNAKEGDDCEKTSYGSYTPQEFSEAEKKYYEKRIKDSVSGTARKGLGSQLLLWGSLAVIAQVVFTIIFVFSKKASVAASAVTGLAVSFTPVFYVCCVIAVLLELLAAAGFILNFVYARDNKGPFKTAGLTLIQIFSVIGLIASCFAVFAVCALGFVMGASLITFYNMHNMTISTGGLYALVCIALSAFILLGLAITFFIRVLVSVSRAKKAVFSGTMKKNISAYAGVIFFIIAAALLAGAALCAVRALSLSLMLIAAAVMLAAACVLYGIFFFVFRKKMKKVM